MQLDRNHVDCDFWILHSYAHLGRNILIPTECRLQERGRNPLWRANILGDCGVCSLRGTWSAFLLFSSRASRIDSQRTVDFF